MKKVCALVVTKDPDDKLPARIDSYIHSVDHLILVDNGSQGSSVEVIDRVSEDFKLEVIRNKRNLGIAAALNLGAHEAIDQGFEWILTLDQDSIPAPEMVEHMVNSLNRQDAKNNIIIVAPRIVDMQVGREALFLQRVSKFRYRRVRCDERDLEDVSTVITSGALINLKCLEELGGFREDLFIDYVDTEFCLRAVNSGYRILVCCNALINHQFGARVMVKRGPLILFPSFHPPDRWYTISRNRIQLLRSFAVKNPYWLFYELVATTYTFWRMILTEDRKLEKVRAIIRGTIDGLFGRFGPPYWADSG